MKINDLILVILIAFISFNAHAQKKIINDSNYQIFKNAIKHYFNGKKISDSLFYNSDLVKKNLDTREIKRAIKRRKKRDTLYIKSTSDKFDYERFLKNDARWKTEKWYKKIKSQLESIFSKAEVINYKKQLEDNNYFWDENKIDNKDRVFVINDSTNTRKEISQMPQARKDSLLRENSKLTKHKNVYTFSKPIFSIDKKIALITYSNIANNVLLIYEKKDGDWHFKYLLSENGFVDRVVEH